MVGLEDAGVVRAVLEVEEPWSIAVVCLTAARAETEEDIADEGGVEDVAEDEGTETEHSRKVKYQHMGMNRIPPPHKYHLNLAVVAALVIA